MGLISKVFGFLFGGGRNVIAETAGVFRENVEAGAQRHAQYSQAALAQLGAEFAIARKGWFDRFMDGLNRLPRPLIVISTFALFASSMFDPLWFAERMQGLQLVPDPLWWLAGTIVSFYFAGRFQFKSQQHNENLAQTQLRLPKVMQNIEEIRALRHDSPGVAKTGTDADLTHDLTSTARFSNPAVDDWRTNL